MSTVKQAHARLIRPALLLASAQILGIHLSQAVHWTVLFSQVTSLSTFAWCLVSFVSVMEQVVTAIIFLPVCITVAKGCQSSDYQDIT